MSERMIPKLTVNNPIRKYGSNVNPSKFINPISKNPVPIKGENVLDKD